MAAPRNVLAGQDFKQVPENRRLKAVHHCGRLRMDTSQRIGFPDVIIDLGDHITDLTSFCAGRPAEVPIHMAAWRLLVPGLPGERALN